MSIHTAYKYRHYRLGDSGERELIWAKGVDLRKELILAGSDLDKEVQEAQEWSLNALADEGEVDMLDVYFNDQAVRTTLYFRLYNDTPIETDTLATLTGEVTGTGYDGIAVTRNTDWTAPAHDTGTTTSTKTFTGGSGGWTVATQLVLATVQNGTAGLFLAWDALSASRTLLENDTLDVDLTVTAE